MDNMIFGVTAALLSSMSWAMCSLLFKKLEEGIDPVTLVTFKTTFGSLILLILIFLTGTNFSIGIANLPIVALSALLGTVVGDILFFASLNRLSPMTLSVILFAAPVIFSGIFGYLFLNETVTMFSLFAIVIVLAGLYLLIFPIKDNNNAPQTKLSGIVFAILSLIATSFSSVLIKPLLVNNSALTITMYRMTFSSIVLIFYGVLFKKISLWKKVITNKRYPVELFKAISLSTIGGFWFSIVAIKHCKLIIASLLLSFEPLFILIFMILFYNYIPKKRELVGVILSVIGVLLCTQKI